jgi:adenine/guanine phosphoribosyltransferase-like PRPP-binding protein
MTARAMPEWKGLDTSQMPVFIGYDQVERMVAALLESAAAWRPDAVVGLARGGVVPAAMAAGILALPLSFVGHDKTTGVVRWIGPPASGRRILLVDDCCSSGVTLRRACAMLCDEGRECLTLVVVHDPDTVRHMPDLSFPMRALFRLPWERGEATPTGRAAKASGTNDDLRVEAPFVGLGLDASLLACVAAGPDPPSGRAVLISGLPASEQGRIAAALAATGYRELPLECRPNATGGDRLAIARFKADAATRWGCTHFIETDAAQAIAISGHAPHLIVTWWSLEDGWGWTVGAAMQPAAEA